MRDYVFVLFFVALIPVCVFRPFVGVLAWSWVSYFNPHEFTWGFARTLPVAEVVALATILGLLLTRKRKFPAWSRETALLIMLWVWFGFTTLNCRYFSPEFADHAAAAVTKYTTVCKILFMTFVSLALVIDEKRLRWWYLVTAGSFALFAFKSTLFGIVTAGHFRVYGPPNSMIADNNDFGLAMNMALPMFWCLARTESSRKLRLAFRAAFVCGIVAVVLSYSRGALLGLAVVLVALSWRSRRRLLAFAAIGAAGILLLALLPGQWTQRMETLRQGRAATDTSAESRIQSWTFATRLALAHPVLGGGFETFTPSLYERFYVVGGTGGGGIGPHSIYFQALAEHGFPGLLLFLALGASCLWSCRKLRSRFRRSGQFPALADYAVMSQVSLLAFLISGAFLGRAYFDLYYQIVATVIVLKYLARRQLTAPNTETTEEAGEFQTVPVSTLPV